MGHELHRASFNCIDPIAALFFAILGVLEPTISRNKMILGQNFNIGKFRHLIGNPFCNQIEQSQSKTNSKKNKLLSPAVAVLFPHIEAHHTNAFVIISK